jgi:hypothetical protein
LFRFELECGEKENQIVTKSMKRQLDQVIIYEQVENGVAINKIVNTNQIV